MPYEHSKPSLMAIFSQPLLTLFILTSFIIIQTECFNFKQVSRSSVSKTINIRTSYSFVLDRTIDNSGVSTAWNTQTVPSNGNVSIVFPSQYVLTGTQTCGSIVIVAGVSVVQTFYPTTYGCTVAGNSVIFTGAFTSISDLYIRNVTLTYNNILNPSPAIKTGQFNSYLGNDIGLGNGQTWIQLIAANFTNCSVTFGNGAIVNSTGPVIFNLTLLNQLNSSSSIKVNFPTGKVWANDISQTILPIQTGTMSCTGLSTNTMPIPTCTGNYTAFNVITSSIFSTVISSGQTISYQINNFISPPTLQPSDTLTITSSTNGYDVDICTTTISGLKPKSFESLTIASINGQMTVNSNVGIMINMTFSDTIDQNDTFSVTFPTSLGVVYNTVSTSGSSEGVSSLNGQVLAVSQNMNISVIYYKDSFLVINFYTMTAPSSIKQSDLIIVQLLRNGYQKMIGSATITATPSSLVCIVTPQSLLVSTQTLYTFTITLSDKLNSSGWLELYFPSDIILNSSIVTIASASGTNINSYPLFNVNTILNKIIITGLNISNVSLITPQTLNITIGMITNPTTTKTSNNFTIKSYYQPGTTYLVAVGQCAGITATPGILNSASISITKSSDIVLATNINYTILFTTTYPIPQNSIIIITIPNDITIDLINLQSNCYQSINSSISIIANCSAFLNTSTNKYQLKISSIALNNDVSGNTNVGIQLQSICSNPDNTRNVIGFGINIYSADGYIIEGANSGISTRASTPAQCLGVNITRGSNQNSDITNYTITLKQPSNLSSSSYLLLTIPIQLQLTNSTSCIDLTGTITLSCNIINTNNTITILLPARSINNMTTFGIVLTNVINIASFQPLNDNFTLLTKTPDNINKYCQYNNAFLFQNNIPSIFSSISGTYTPRIYNQLTSLIVNFTPSTRLIPSYLIVSLATQLTVSSLSCSFQGIVGGLCTQVSTNMIKVQGTFTSNSMQFTIGGLIAPKFSQSVPQYSSITSFTSSNYTIDSSINLISFTVLCTLPCKTCATSNTSQCLSCYQDITISTAIYYISSLNTCYSVCPDGYYSDSVVLTCSPCNSGCLTCNGVADNCTACNVSSTLKYLYFSASSNSGTCLSQCPSFYYINSLNQCTPCQSPCSDCTSLTTCITCTSPFYMLNSSCTSLCPSLTTIPNNLTRSCDACSTVCATCSGNINNCTTCSSNTAYYNGSCVASCPPPLVINAGQCGGCDPICKQCSLTSTNCTKCNTSSSVPYLYNFTCLNDCPSQYYKDILNGVCSPCINLNIGCKFCSTVSTCISCDLGYVFLNNKCYSSTPTGYYNNNGYAMPCSGDCATCSDTASNCTSCLTLNLDGYRCVANCSVTKVAINKTCVACQAPCLTCSNIQTNCTSCIPNLTPAVFLNNFYCTTTCPDYTYANSTTSTCAPCQSPCLMCTSSSSCLSCINGMYLLNTTCSSSCPNGYIGINKVCQPCTAPCMTCQITQTRCLSCELNYYLYNSSSPSCISDCFAVGMYPDPILQICTGCQPPCITCSTTSRTCTSCNQSMILFNNNCISSCPLGYYQQASSCVACPIACATCTSSTICQSCTISYYFLLNYCVSSCPTQYPVITTDGRCQQCSDMNCRNCTAQDYCQQCMQPYYLYLGTCVIRCPLNYSQLINSSTNFRQCIYESSINNNTNNTTNNTTINNTTEQNLTQTLKSGGNLFPVPMTIASAFIGVATIMSKFQNSFTFISGVLYSLWGITEWASVAIMLWYFYNWYGWHHIQFYILAGSFSFLYLLNLLALFVQNIYLRNDANFKKWLTMGNNRCFYYFVSIVGFLATHKFKNFIFCKMFNFVFLKARLDSVQQFRVFNAFSFLSFLSSAGILFGLGLTFVTYEQILDQKLMFFIDATVLTAINVFLAVLNSRKEADFFYQKTQDGFTVHKRIQDFDQLLYGGLIPIESQQKFDQLQLTGKKLLARPYESIYRNLKSQTSQDSIRVMMDISIQAQSILGQQSIITHLNDGVLSDIDLFDRKDVSIQFDQPQREVYDKSISMIKFKQKEVQDKSVSMIRWQNNEISVQMDNVQHNQISVQVSNDQEEVSVQYGPNVLDCSIAMSREEQEISMQVGPVVGEVSVQYSAKPVFVDLDQEYDDVTENDNEIEQSTPKKNKHQQQHQSQKSLKIQIQNHSELIPSNNNSLSQSHITTRIKKPDELLQPELQLDVNEKLMRREAELRRLEEEERNNERLRIIAEFQKKILVVEQKRIPINYQVNSIIQQAFVPKQLEQHQQNEQQYNNKEQIIIDQQKIQQYQQTEHHHLTDQQQQTDSQHNKIEIPPLHYNQTSGTIMSSRLDIFNHHQKQQQEHEFSSNQSRVQNRLNTSHNNSINHSIGGQKSQQEFIQMLSGNNKNSQEHNGQQQQMHMNEILLNKNQNRVFYKQQQRVLDLEEDQEIVMSSNVISLNMTDQNDSAQQQYNNNSHHKHPHRATSQPTKPPLIIANYKFQDRNQIFQSDEQQDDFQPPSDHSPFQPDFSHQLTKSTSTKNMTRINGKQPQSKGIQQGGSLLDTSNGIDESVNSLAERVIGAPLHEVNKMKNNGNSIIKNQLYEQDLQLSHHNHRSISPKDSSQRIKSAYPTKINYEVNFKIIQQQRDFNDDSIENQHDNQSDKEKQQPLPIPTEEVQNMDDENQQNELEFEETQKVLVSPFNTEEIRVETSQMPLGVLGVNSKLSKVEPKKRNLPKSQNKNLNNNSKKGQRRGSRSRQKPVQNELLNPSTSIRGRNMAKQLQKQQRRAQNRKKNIQLMQGMLERPSNSRKHYTKEEQEQRKRTGVEKIYLNRQAFIQYK